MGKKTLGIIGPGKVVQDLFEYLSKSAVSHERQPSGKAIFPSASSFSDVFERVILYNHAYSDPAYFRETASFQKILNSLSHLSDAGYPTISCEVLGKARYDEDSNEHTNIREDSGELEKLLICSDVVVDASGMGPSFMGNGNTSSLIRYALEKIAPSSGSIGEKSLNFNDDYIGYQATELRKGAGRASLSRAQFQRQWEVTKELVEAAAKVNTQFPLGIRSVVATPHNLPLLLSRAVLLQEAVARMHSKGIQQLPTYIMAANEPCTLSYFLALQVPALAQHLVASAEIDARRLEHELNTEYASLKIAAGLLNTPLKVIVSGFHDGSTNAHLTVPIIYPQNPADDENFAKILGNGRVSYEQLHHFVQERVSSFYMRHRVAKDNPPEIDELMRMDKGLLETILCAAKSREKALSLEPPVFGPALNNGYYVRDATVGPQGYFVVGKHRFRNGRTHGEPLRTGDGAIHEFITQEVGTAVNAMQMLIYGLSGPVQQYIQELKAEIGIKTGVVEFVARTPELSLEKELEKSCYVVVRKLKGDRELGSSVLTYSRQRGEWKGPQLMVGGNSASRPYHKVISFTIENVPYLAAAFSDQMRNGIELINLRTIAENSEHVNIILDDQTNPLARDPLAHDRSGCSFTGMGVIDAGSLEGYLVAMHTSLGLYALPFNSLLLGEKYTLDHSKRLLGLPPHSNIALEVGEQEVIVALDHDIYRTKDLSKPITRKDLAYTLPEPVVSLAVDQHKVYAATTKGKIFEEKQLFFEPATAITKIHAGEFGGTTGIYYLSKPGGGGGVGNVLHTNGQQPVAIITGAILDFAVNGRELFAVERERLHIFSDGDKVYETDLKDADLKGADVRLKALSVWG